MNLKEIRERVKKATKGPWRWDVNLNGKYVELESSNGWGDIVLNFVRWGMGGAGIRFNVGGIMVRCDDERLAKVIPGREHHASWARVIDHPDASFIAHARTDVPELLDALEEALGFGGHTAECAVLEPNQMSDPPKKCDCGWAKIEKELG